MSSTKLTTISEGNHILALMPKKDIRNLQAVYSQDVIHIYKPGRKLNDRDKVKDYIAVGSEGMKLKKTIEGSLSRCDTDILTTQCWDHLKYCAISINLDRLVTCDTAVQTGTFRQALNDL
jgi:hypothetical protein